VKDLLLTHRIPVRTGELMTQYLVAIYRPENYDPAVSEDEAMGRREVTAVTAHW
jgi:hypothetical protein